MIVIVPELATIAPPSSEEVLFSNEESMIFKVPLSKRIAPPPELLVTVFPVKVQSSKVAVAPALLLKKTPPPARVVLKFENKDF